MWGCVVRAFELVLWLWCICNGSGKWVKPKNWNTASPFPRFIIMVRTISFMVTCAPNWCFSKKAAAVFSCSSDPGITFTVFRETLTSGPRMENAVWRFLFPPFADQWGTGTLKSRIITAKTYWNRRGKFLRKSPPYRYRCSFTTRDIRRCVCSSSYVRDTGPGARGRVDIVPASRCHRRSMTIVNCNSSPYRLAIIDGRTVANSTFAKCTKTLMFAYLDPYLNCVVFLCQ